ncbi:MAG: hypothetical protein M0C28_38125 [Candidatus Moduliflexus flocculans]|nr:hypothetical protein [Candidatus Moduliflexus flocculans]
MRTESFRVPDLLSWQPSAPRPRSPDGSDVAGRRFSGLSLRRDAERDVGRAEARRTS